MFHFLIASTYFLIPRSSFHALIYAGLLGGPATEWQCYHDAAAVSHQGQLVEIPLISSLSPSLCIHPPNPLPFHGQGEAALLLLTALHKCLKRSEREREGGWGGWRAQMQSKKGAKILPKEINSGIYYTNNPL